MLPILPLRSFLRLSNYKNIYNNLIEVWSHQQNAKTGSFTKEPVFLIFIYWKSSQIFFHYLTL